MLSDTIRYPNSGVGRERAYRHTAPGKRASNQSREAGTSFRHIRQCHRPSPRGQCCIFKLIPCGDSIMFSFRFVMIQSDPAMTNMTMNKPNASANTLLVLSGAVVM